MDHFSELFSLTNRSATEVERQQLIGELAFYHQVRQYSAATGDDVTRSRERYKSALINGRGPHVLSQGVSRRWRSTGRRSPCRWRQIAGLPLLLQIVIVISWLRRRLGDWLRKRIYAVLSVGAAAQFDFLAVETVKRPAATVGVASGLIGGLSRRAPPLISRSNSTAKGSGSSGPFGDKEASW